MTLRSPQVLYPERLFARSQVDEPLSGAHARRRTYVHSSSTRAGMDVVGRFGDRTTTAHASGVPLAYLSYRAEGGTDTGARGPPGYWPTLSACSLSHDGELVAMC